jgi:hypothetical protein
MNQHDFLRILIREDLERRLLYEGLIYTYSLEKLLPELRSLKFKRNQFSFYNNKITIHFDLNNNNEKRYLELNRIMDNVGGWFHGASIAGSVLKNKLDFINVTNGVVTLQYEPKHDIEMGVPDIIYHLTKQNKVDKIKRNGLTPRSSVDFFNFNDRVYFSTNKESLKDLALQKKYIELNKIAEKEKSGSYKSKKQKDLETKEAGKFLILTVKPNFGRTITRFFKDPNFIDGYYTKENLKPSSIIDIENLDV